MERINTALAYSEFEYQKREHVLVEGNDKALGFETMFYKCPCCGSEFTLSTDGNDVKCSNCGTVATFQDDFTFKWNTEKQYFENYSQWYDWQYEKILEEVKQPDFKLEDEVDYEIDEPGVDQYVKVGHGVMTFSHDGWDYKGTYRDREFEEHDEPRSVFIATLTVGKHFQLPNRDGHSRAYAPANPLTSMKWHLASRAMSEILQNQ